MNGARCGQAKKQKRLAKNIMNDTVTGNGIIIQGFTEVIVRVLQQGVDNGKRIGMGQRRVHHVYGKVHVGYIFYRLDPLFIEGAHHDQGAPLRSFAVAVQDWTRCNEQGVVANHDKPGVVAAIGGVVEKLFVAGEFGEQVRGDRHQHFLLGVKESVVDKLALSVEIEQIIDFGSGGEGFFNNIRELIIFVEIFDEVIRVIPACPVMGNGIKRLGLIFNDRFDAGNIIVDKPFFYFIEIVKNYPLKQKIKNHGQADGNKTDIGENFFADTH